MTMEMANKSAAAAPAKQTSARGSKPKRLLGKRHLIVLMATMAPLVCYISRQNLSMAIVAMIDDSQLVAGHPTAPLQISTASSTLATNTTTTTTTSRRYLNQADSFYAAYSCPKPLIRDEHGKTVSAVDSFRFGPRYRWSPSQKSLIFEAFFWTYFAGQVPGARFAELIGAKWALALATVGSSLLSALTPWAASTSVYALALLRALLGVCQAALFPALYVLYSRWLPPLERSQALSVIGVGTYLGSIIASTSAGYFIQQRHFGWEYAFYMASVICALWSLIWIYVGASEPTLDRHIKQTELDYIMSKINTTNNNSSSSSSSSSGSGQVPGGTKRRKAQISWKKVFASKAVWAFMVANFASEWPFTTVLILLPTYLNDILNITPLINGMINSTIYIIYCLTSPVVGVVSSYMVAKRSCGLSVLNIRKLFEGTALYGSALCFLLLPIIGCQTSIVLGALFMQIILFSFVNGGEVQLPSEMSVEFTGTIYAVGNCAATTTGFIVPRVHSLIVSNSHDRHQWELYFYLTALVVTLCALLFTIFAGNNPKDYSADSRGQRDQVEPESRENNNNNNNNKEEIMTMV